MFVPVGLPDTKQLAGGLQVRHIGVFIPRAAYHEEHVNDRFGEQGPALTSSRYAQSVNKTWKSSNDSRTNGSNRLAMNPRVNRKPSDESGS